MMSLSILGFRLLLTRPRRLQFLVGISQCPSFLGPPKRLDQTTMDSIRMRTVALAVSNDSQ
jgi:hypothetical protein